MWGRKGALEPDNCPNLLLDFGYFHTECTVFRVSHILPDASPPFGSTLHVKRQCPVTPARASAIVCRPFLCDPSQREFLILRITLYVVGGGFLPGEEKIEIRCHSGQPFETCLQGRGKIK